MKHLEARQKYSAARRIFNSLLRVSSGDETLHLMFDILHADTFICKFATLCHQPSQQFLIRDINFSDPLLNFSFIKRAFILSPTFRIYHVPKLQRKIGRIISLQI